MNSLVAADGVRYETDRSRPEVLQRDAHGETHDTMSNPSFPSDAIASGG